MLDKTLISNFEKKFLVDKDPFPNIIINDFLPIEIVRKAENEFISYKKTINSGNTRFQKTKMHSDDYANMPHTIKKIIYFFYSKDFVKLLETKFNLRNILPDWNFYGGGMHESFKGGFLKVHSDFLYIRKSKLKRVLNLLLYLNSNWQENWKGSIELWDKNMSSVRKSVAPEINNAVIFRTDMHSNHGFPEPLSCPENVSRRSIALYYYIKEKTLFPISIRRTKHFHAVWKKRPSIDEPKFADKDSFFKRLKLKFFYRFF